MEKVSSVGIDCCEHEIRDFVESCVYERDRNKGCFSVISGVFKSLVYYHCTPTGADERAKDILMHMPELVNSGNVALGARLLEYGERVDLVNKRIFESHSTFFSMIFGAERNCGGLYILFTPKSLEEHIEQGSFFKFLFNHSDLCESDKKAAVRIYAAYKLQEKISYYSKFGVRKYDGEFDFKMLDKLVEKKAYEAIWCFLKTIRESSYYTNPILLSYLPGVLFESYQEQVVNMQAALMHVEGFDKFLEALEGYLRENKDYWNEKGKTGLAYILMKEVIELHGDAIIEHAKKKNPEKTETEIESELDAMLESLK